ncbi:TetR/AcrR family transcriptional regulator [Saxibacter everestensis]|uniref:TetR/AcrR family transcriptional regulator n=1 Tax=Saxibacter everestensis TaxID=2909229 RepID=A0ABY8QPY7_9MICO|nr:TetR/AcrR family transcriptional regulator [Brevibacteriaceae bacterium ZFBP1038]
MTAQQTREKILDALEKVLVQDGPQAVTLEAVAKSAGVSKGGLLYHFGSKQELIGGLVDRLAEVTDKEIAEARTGQQSVARWFLETSVPGPEDEMSLYWSVIAVLRTADGAEDSVSKRIESIFTHWIDALHDEVKDPVLAETIRLVGDGLFLSAVAGLPVPDEALMRKVFDRLLSQLEA